MKNENSTLLRKLMSYSALAAPIIAGTRDAKGQIVYTNLNPDVTINQHKSAYGIDLNGDANIDYVIAIYDTISSKNHIVRQVYAIPYSSNSIAASTAGTSYVYPLALNAGAIIDANRHWDAYGSQYMGTFVGTNPGGALLGTYGNWINAKDRYLGLRFFVGSTAVYYGWARLDSRASKDSVYATIKSFAYQSIPDSSIVAGDTGSTNVGIQQVSINKIMMFGYEKQVYISSPTSAKGTMVIRVINMAGQEVKFYSTDQNQFHFSLTDLPDGFYMVTAEQDGLIQTKKISLK